MTRFRSALLLLVCGAAFACSSDSSAPVAAASSGQAIFRHDTFGSEALWTETLRIHEVIRSSVSPRTALGVGLKVDAAALPSGILETADLDDPATTVALIGLGAVVGVEGRVDGDGTLRSVGVTCALCHSTVDDSVAPGIGLRLDGRANRDLDPGAILALSPAMQEPQTQATLLSWGPGYYDAYWNVDGLNDPTRIPPIYGLDGVDRETYTGVGPVGYWNRYVAITQMGGQGTFRNDFHGIDVTADPDLVTPKIPALIEYQLSLRTPPPAPGSFDPVAAARGERVFHEQGNCASCHVPPTYTDANFRLHAEDAVGTDPLHARRSETGRYRTTPLRGLQLHPPYFHDGSAATLDDVVDHYDGFFALGLTDAEKHDLVEFLKTR